VRGDECSREIWTSVHGWDWALLSRIQRMFVFGKQVGGASIADPAVCNHRLTMLPLIWEVSGLPTSAVARPAWPGRHHGTGPQRAAVVAPWHVRPLSSTLTGAVWRPDRPSLGPLPLNLLSKAQPTPPLSCPSRDHRHVIQTWMRSNYHSALSLQIAPTGPSEWAFAPFGVAHVGRRLSTLCAEEGMR